VRQREASPWVSPALDRVAAHAWRVLVIGATVAAGFWLIGQLLIVVIPVVVALLATRLLHPVQRVLRSRVPAAVAAALTLGGFVVAVALVLALVGVSVGSELDGVGTTVRDGIDEVEDWLVDDAPFDISRSDVESARERVGDALSRFVSSSDGAVRSGAVLAAEVVAGLLLAIVLTFFFLKDDRQLVRGLIRVLPSSRRAAADRLGHRGWDALGAYLRGAALLGIVEATVIGVTLLLVGADLALAVAAITFVAAFVPIVGAVVAGVVATLVALVTASPVAALIVAVVALVVQQLDNDLLGPLVYGRALRLHPLVILLGIAVGGALFGIVGTVLAVPVLAVVWNVVDEARQMAAANERLSASLPGSG
jgi:predicted PurR-regulated permease PerM